MIKTIDGAAFSRMMLSAAAEIDLNKQKVNELNVFPVPDGDTGTNMSMTLSAASTELRKADGITLTKAADKTASALLRGARGNSGVILSLLFRGFSKSLKGKLEADGKDFAAALTAGVEAAYKAVMKPAEGTILTVSRLTADAARDLAEENNEIEYVLQHCLDTAHAALDNTVNQNPVLKKAGVVDAGGMGFCLILRGMLESLRGNDIVCEDTGTTNEEADFGIFDSEDITFAFDTVFIVRKREDITSLDPLREYLGSIGDSLVIGEDDEAFKVHVHTNIPGDALSEAQKYGTLELAKIENMRLQHDDLTAGRKARSTDDLETVEKELESQPAEQAAPAEPEKRYGSVAVCAGAGLAGVFRDLGVDEIIEGGQTMNPSTEDILHAIEKTPAEIVFVLPNNKNIIMAAQAAAELASREVVVIPTKTVPQGISAMLSFDAAMEPSENEAAMTGCLSGVMTMQITYAARDSDFDGFDIHAGDYLGLCDGALAGTARGYLDTYYLQMVSNIRRFKGAVQRKPVSAPQTIRIRAGERQWKTVSPVYLNDKGTTIHRDWDGFGDHHYKNETGRNDIISAKVTRDADHLYFMVTCAAPITEPTEEGWMTLFLDTDRSKATGWEGFDFAINRLTPKRGKTSVERYLRTADADSFTWEKIGEADISVKGNLLQIAVPRALLGMTGTLDFEFKWSDNMQEKNIMDFYRNGDTAPIGRFNYLYRE